MGTGLRHARPRASAVIQPSPSPDKVAHTAKYEQRRGCDVSNVLTGAKEGSMAVPASAQAAASALVHERLSRGPGRSEWWRLRAYCWLDWPISDCNSARTFRWFIRHRFTLHPAWRRASGGSRFRVCEWLSRYGQRRRHGDLYALCRPTRRGGLVRHLQLCGGSRFQRGRGIRHYHAAAGGAERAFNKDGQSASIRKYVFVFRGDRPRRPR